MNMKEMYAMAVRAPVLEGHQEMDAKFYKKKPKEGFIQVGELSDRYRKLAKVDNKKSPKAPKL
jgi:hypothetical protein